MWFLSLTEIEAKNTQLKTTSLSKGYLFCPQRTSSATNSFLMGYASFPRPNLTPLVGVALLGDLVITVRGTIGSVGFFDGAKYPTGFINAQMTIIRARKDVIPQFLHLVTQGDSWRAQLDFSAYGTAQQQLSNEILCNLVAPIPSADEQWEIVSEVGETQRRIDELIGKVKDAIDRLREYRTALISAAVTGKIDVRGSL